MARQGRNRRGVGGTRADQLNWAWRATESCSDLSLASRPADHKRGEVQLSFHLRSATQRKKKTHTAWLASTVSSSSSSFASSEVACEVFLLSFLAAAMVAAEPVRLMGPSFFLRIGSM